MTDAPKPTDPAAGTGGAAWVPPDGWGPRPEPVPAAQPVRGWWITRTPRRRAWIILAGMLALLGIYLSVITYYLAGHMIARYEQVPPGTTVTVLHTDYTLLELAAVDAPPSGNGGRTDPPEKRTAYAVAKVRILEHAGSEQSYPCSGTKLVDDRGRAWESIYTSSLPPSEDTDYCDGVKVGVPAVVTIAYAYPDSSVDRIAGVGVEPDSGAPAAVLVPPGS